MLKLQCINHILLEGQIIDPASHITVKSIQVRCSTVIHIQHSLSMSVTILVKSRIVQMDVHRGPTLGHVRLGHVHPYSSALAQLSAGSELFCLYPLHLSLAVLRMLT